MMPIDQALRDLQEYQNAEEFDQQFEGANARLKEIKPQVKQVVDTMSAEQKKKYEKKREKKVKAQIVRHREKLQRQFDEAAKDLPNDQKMKLNEQMKRMPVLRQEQLVAELISQHNSEQNLSEQERQD